MSEHDIDLVAWAEEQASLLRRRAANALDWDNLAEEIEDLSRSDRREIRHRLAVLCEHLLKWAYQADHRSGSWRGSIVEARERIADVIEESPSLAAYPAERLLRSYTAGRDKAVAETGVQDMPSACPWTIDQVVSRDFWPD